jgi:hypothetical protein
MCSHLLGVAALVGVVLDGRLAVRFLNLRRIRALAHAQDVVELLGVALFLPKEFDAKKERGEAGSVSGWRWVCATRHLEEEGSSSSTAGPPRGASPRSSQSASPWHYVMEEKAREAS